MTAEIIGLGGESILLNGHVDELSSKYLHPHPRISAVFSLGQGSCSLQQAMVSLETCLVRVVGYVIVESSPFVGHLCHLQQVAGNATEEGRWLEVLSSACGMSLLS